MAGNTTIGKLNVQITGSAKELESTLSTAEKRLAGFATKAASPLTSLVGSVGRIPGIVAGPAGVIAGSLLPVGDLLEKLPEMLTGSKLESIRRGLGEETFHKTAERLEELHHAAENLSIRPTFLRSLQLAAGPEADKVTGMVTKFEKAMVSLRSGVQIEGLPTTGIEKALAPLGREAVEGIKNAGSIDEALTRTFQAMRELEDQTSKAGVAFALFGKQGLKAVGIAEKFESALGEVKAHGGFGEEVGEKALQFGEAKRVFDLQTQAAENERFLIELPIKFAKLNEQLGKLTPDQRTRLGGIVNQQRFRDLFGISTDPKALGQHLFDAGLISGDQLRLITGEGLARKPPPKARTTDEILAGQRAEATDTLEKFNLGLQEQIDLWGKNAAQAAAYKAELAGVDDKLVEMTRARAGILEANKIAETLKTPTEQAGKRLGEIRDLTGFLTGDEKAKAIAKEFNQRLNLDAIFRRGAGAVPFIEAGSQADAAFRDALQGKGLEEQMKTNTDVIAAALRELKAAEDKNSRDQVEQGKAIEKAVQQQIANIFP